MKLLSTPSFNPDRFFRRRNWTLSKIIGYKGKFRNVKIPLSYYHEEVPEGKVNDIIGHFFVLKNMIHLRQIKRTLTSKFHLLSQGKERKSDRERFQASMKKAELAQKILQVFESDNYADMTMAEMSKLVGTTPTVFKSMIAEIAMANERDIDSRGIIIFEKEHKRLEVLLDKITVELNAILDQIKQERESGEAPKTLMAAKSTVSEWLNSVVRASESIRKLHGLDQPRQVDMELVKALELKMTHGFLTIFQVVKKYLNTEQYNDLLLHAKQAESEMLKDHHNLVMKKGRDSVVEVLNMQKEHFYTQLGTSSDE